MKRDGELQNEDNAQTRSLRTTCLFTVPWTLIVLQAVIIVVVLCFSSILPQQHSTCTNCSIFGQQSTALRPETGQSTVSRNWNASPQDNVSVSQNVNVRRGDILPPGLSCNDTSSSPMFLPSCYTVNSARVFYNRIPKCGSSTLIDLIGEMSHWNKFKTDRAPEFMRFYLDKYWQKKFADRFYSFPAPMLYERHLHFLDFTRHGYYQPIYFNILRDPLERMVSWYYFRRFQDGHVRQMSAADRNMTFDECVLSNHPECTKALGDYPEEGYFKIIPFFCGQLHECREEGYFSLSTAIKNVKKHYILVGLMERYAEFIEALEFLMPSFFHGAVDVYNSYGNILQHRHKTTFKQEPSPKVVAIMKQKLRFEYQFYRFIQNRFNKLMTYIRSHKNVL